MKSTTKRKDRDIPISVVLSKNNPNPDVDVDREKDIAETNEYKKANEAITHYQLMQVRCICQILILIVNFRYILTSTSVGQFSLAMRRIFAS